MVNLPTPTQKLHHPLLEEKGIRLHVKRDDLTHPEVMGNKWRKLKYNLEAVLSQKKIGLITMGGAYSNHIAAVGGLFAGWYWCSVLDQYFAQRKLFF